MERVIFTDKDYAAFESFTRVNPNICFNQDELSVVHPTRFFIARWKGFKFPTIFPIYDAEKLRSSMHHLKIREFDVDINESAESDSQIVISKDTGYSNIEYTFRWNDPTLFESHRTRVRSTFFDAMLNKQPNLVFDFKQDYFNEIKSIYDIFDAKDFLLNFSNNQLKIEFDKRGLPNVGSAHFEIPVSYEGPTFSMRFAYDPQFKLIHSGDYRCRVFYNEGEYEYISLSMLEEVNEVPQEIGWDYILMSGKDRDRR